MSEKTYTLELTEEEARWLLTFNFDPYQRLSARIRAALPQPIVWETHMGVEMARAGDRVALMGDEAISVCPSWSSRDGAERWLRGEL